MDSQKKISFFLHHLFGGNEKSYTFALAIAKQHCLNESKNVGAIAQLVEQRTENPCVPGSIPGGTTQKTITKP